MFGYIKADRANLLGKEYEAYRGVYCALCKQLGRDYSLFARFILSYDCTFYAVMILDLAEEPPSYCQGRCRFNPMKKCSYALTGTEALSMAAALSVSSAYFKLRDNIIDSPWYKRLLYRLPQPLFALWRRKAKRRYPDIDAALERMLAEQLAAERDPQVSLDSAAEPTARMLSAVCALIPDEISVREQDITKLKRVLSAFGYFLGRWVYLIDAADDYEDDVRRGSFNPFALSGHKGEDISGAMLPALNHALSETLLSYGLLDKGCFDPIIRNVLMISCVNEQNRVLGLSEQLKQNGENYEESL